MKQLTLFFTLFLLYHGVVGQETLKVQLKNNLISVTYGDKERLNKGLIDFESTDYPIKKSALTSRGNNAKIVYSSGGKKSVEIIAESNQNVVTFQIKPNQNNSSNGQKYTGLFFDIPGYQIGTALWRYGESKAWTKPVLVKTLSQINSVGVQFFYWRYQDGLYGVAIPLGGNGFSSSLGRDGNKFGSKAFSLKDNFYTQEFPLVAVAFGRDIYKTIEQLIERGMETMGYPENLRKKKKFPTAFENFGWCTWDAFGQKVNEQKVIEGVESFSKNDFPVPMVLIDDGWLQVGEEMKLKSFVPDPVKFPNQFKSLVGRLKKEYNVQDVGIWHTINAYWKGVDSASFLGKKYKDHLYAYQGKMAWSKDSLKTFYTPTPTSDKGMKFFDDWYQYLSSQEISFIKVDNQLVVGQISNMQWPIWETGKHLQNNFQVPAKKYFDGNVINCMEMTTDNIYHFGSSAIARASDDYMPKEISYNLESGNAAVHIVNCLYNSLWLSNIVWPDYDMFESYQLYPEYHAIARAISGGPIYVSDWPGEQNFDVLRPLITKQGKILRTDVPAQLTEDCLFQLQVAKPLKAFSVVGNAGLIGVWNASNSGLVKGTMKPSDIFGIEGKDFAVYEYFSKEVKNLGKEDTLSLTLTWMDYRLFVVIPIEYKAAVIGLTNKYNSPKTIIRKEITEQQISVSVQEGGKVGIYLDKAPESVIVNDTQLNENQFSFRKNLLEVQIQESGLEENTIIVQR